MDTKPIIVVIESKHENSSDIVKVYSYPDNFYAEENPIVAEARITTERARELAQALIEAANKSEGG